MTWEEMNDTPHLPNEIKRLDDKLRQLQNPARIADKRKAGEYADALEELRTVLQDCRERRARQLDRQRAFIDGIHDPLLHEVFRLRYTEGKTWVQVSVALGGERTDDSLKKMVHRFFKKVKEE